MKLTLIEDDFVEIYSFHCSIFASHVIHSGIPENKSLEAKQGNGFPSSPIVESFSGTNFQSWADSSTRSIVPQIFRWLFSRCLVPIIKPTASEWPSIRFFFHPLSHSVVSFFFFICARRRGHLFSSSTSHINISGIFICTVKLTKPGIIGSCARLWLI